MIDRYRKAGGFVQLVALLESCAPTKREKFLNIIRQEAPSWADVLPAKLIDIDRVYSWSDETLAEIVGTLQDLCVAVAIRAGGPELKERVYRFLNQGRRRRIDDLLELKEPSSGEIATMHIKIIETVRRMSKDGHLRFEKFDPALVIEDEIETTLDRRGPVIIEEAPPSFAIEYSEDSVIAEVEPVTAVTSITAIPESVDLSQLRKKLSELIRENANLRKELTIARGKLDQIKKIA